MQNIEYIAVYRFTGMPLFAMIYGAGFHISPMAIETPCFARGHRELCARPIRFLRRYRQI